MRAASSMLSRVKIRRTLVHQRLRYFHHFERIADRVAQRLVHVGDQRLHALVHAPPDSHHHLRQPPRVHLLLDERAAAHLHVEHQGVQAFSHLLRHDGRRDQRNRFHGGRDITQRVELAVGRRHPVRLPDEAQADLAQLRVELFHREIGAKAGNGFQLVERAAGVSQRAAGHHGHDHARGRSQRRHDQAGLVAHAAGRVLVDLDALNTPTDPRSRRSGSCTRSGADLAVRHAGEKHGHKERRHLVVRVSRRGCSRRSDRKSLLHPVPRRHASDGSNQLFAWK